MVRNKQIFEGEGIKLIGHKGRNIVLLGDKRICLGVKIILVMR